MPNRNEARGRTGDRLGATPNRQPAAAQDSASGLRTRYRSPLRRHARIPVRLALVAAVAAAALVAALPASAANGPIADKRAQAQAARAELARLGAQIEPAVERYNRAVARLARVNEEIAFNERQIRVTQRNLEVAQGELDRRLAEAYRVGDVDLITTILSQQSLASALEVTDLYARTQQRAADVIGGLRTSRALLRKQERDLAVAQDRAQALRAERAAERRRIEAGLAKQRQVVNGLEGEIRQLIAEEAARQERLRQQALAELRAQQAAQAAQAAEQVAIGGSVAAAPAAAEDAGQSAAAGQGDSAAQEPAPQAEPAADPAPAESVAPPPTDGSLGARAVAVAMQYLGTPYVWGGSSPGGFDCSGLTMYAYAQVGVSLSHYTGDQWNEGARVPSDQLLPGDLVFFHSDLHHMGMYIGGGQFIHAPHTGDVVKISDLGSFGSYAGAVRPY